MRKMLAAVLALTLSVGAVLADEIKAVFKKYEDGKLTVTVDEKEKTYTVDAEAKIKLKEKEIPLTEVLANAKAFKEGTKVTITVEKDKVVKVAREKGAKKEDKKDKDK